MLGKHGDFACSFFVYASAWMILIPLFSACITTKREQRTEETYKLCCNERPMNVEHDLLTPTENVESSKANAAKCVEDLPFGPVGLKTRISQTCLASWHLHDSPLCKANKLPQLQGIQIPSLGQRTGISRNFSL